MSKGIIGTKLGMTQVFAGGDELIPVTVIQAGPCKVVQKKTQDVDGYDAIQIGFGAAKAQRGSTLMWRSLSGGTSPHAHKEATEWSY